MVYLAAAGFLDEIMKVYHVLFHSSISADNESASFFSGNDRCAVGIIQDFSEHKSCILQQFTFMRQGQWNIKMNETVIRDCKLFSPL